MGERVTECEVEPREISASKGGMYTVPDDHRTNNRILLNTRLHRREPHHFLVILSSPFRPETRLHFPSPPWVRFPSLPLFPPSSLPSLLLFLPLPHFLPPLLLSSSSLLPPLLLLPHPPSPPSFIVFPPAADSQLPASELRKRYHAGGSAPDSELSASQLRARHGIPANSKGASTRSSFSFFLLRSLSTRPSTPPPSPPPLPCVVQSSAAGTTP